MDESPEALNSSYRRIIIGCSIGGAVFYYLLVVFWVRLFRGAIFKHGSSRFGPIKNSVKGVNSCKCILSGQTWGGTLLYSLPIAIGIPCAIVAILGIYVPFQVLRYLFLLIAYSFGFSVYSDADYYLYNFGKPIKKLVSTLLVYFSIRNPSGQEVNEIATQSNASAVEDEENPAHVPGTSAIPISVNNTTPH
ncbi:hypothetical protein BJV82DRAFT_237359 [Fennellomyces sp. T-0311]|nr:hypothetical protein BJV82DRAFT_237359 [Fennellomyces sp. T-0311]